MTELIKTGIARSIVAVSAPAAGVFTGDERRTVGLARLLNEVRMSSTIAMCLRGADGVFC